MTLFQTQSFSIHNFVKGLAINEGIGNQEAIYVNKPMRNWLDALQLIELFNYNRYDESIRLIMFGLNSYKYDYLLLDIRNASSVVYYINNGW